MFESKEGKQSDSKKKGQDPNTEKKSEDKVIARLQVCIFWFEIGPVPF